LIPGLPTEAADRDFEVIARRYVHRCGRICRLWPHNGPSITQVGQDYEHPPASHEAMILRP